MRNCSLWGTHSPGPGLQRRRAGDSMNGRRLTELPPFREHLNYERRIPRSRCRSLIFAVNDDAPVIAKQFLLILDLCVPNGAFMEQYLVVFLLFSASFTHSRLSMADDARTIIHFNIGTCQIATSTIWNVITKKKKSPSTSRGEDSTFCAPINSFRGIDQTIWNLWILIHAVASFGYTVLHCTDTLPRELKRPRQVTKSVTCLPVCKRLKRLRWAVERGTWHWLGGQPTTSAAPPHKTTA